MIKRSLAQGGGGYNAAMHLQERGDTMMMGFYSNDTQSTGPAIAANTWYNVAWVYNASTQTQSIYVNGELATNGSSGGHPAFAGTGETATIANDCCGGQLKGDITHLFVWGGTALNQDQIRQAMLLPEPSSFALIGFAAVGLLVAARRRRA